LIRGRKWNEEGEMGWARAWEEWMELFTIIYITFHFKILLNKSSLNYNPNGIIVKSNFGPV
jgi:hypothetical protein